MNSIKCPECGLVNFATASECKRCRMCFVAPEQGPHDSQYQHAEYQSYWPQRQEFDEKTQRIFSGGVVFLTGILIVAFAMLVMQQAFHPLDPSAARSIAVLVGLVGAGLMLLTQIWLLVRIFEQSIGWGFASLFLPVVGCIAVGKFWEKTKRSFVGQLVCLGIVFVGFGIGV